MLPQFAKPLSPLFYFEIQLTANKITDNLQRMQLSDLIAFWTIR